MKLTHASNDGLAGFLIGGNHESRILFSETTQRICQLLGVSRGLRLNRHGDHGIRECRRLEHDVELVGVKRVTGANILRPNDRSDIARVTGIDILVIVGLNLNQSTDALLAAGAGIVNLVALGNRA